MQLARDSGSLIDACFQPNIELPRHPAETIIVCARDEDQQQDPRRRSEPPRAPPGRQNSDSQGHAKFPVGATTGRSLYLEYVVPGRKSGVGGGPLITPYF